MLRWCPVVAGPAQATVLLTVPEPRSAQPVACRRGG